jgi:hypothetical protein
MQSPTLDKPAVGNKQKTISKKERRELQDAQRAEKAQLRDKKEKTSGSATKTPKPTSDTPRKVPAQMRQDDPKVTFFTVSNPSARFKRGRKRRRRFIEFQLKSRLRYSVISHSMKNLAIFKCRILFILISFLSVFPLFLLTIRSTIQ